MQDRQIAEKINFSFEKKVILENFHRMLGEMQVLEK